MKRIKELDPIEVSLVPKPANKRKFLIIKSQNRSFEFKPKEGGIFMNVDFDKIRKLIPIKLYGTAINLLREAERQRNNTITLEVGPTLKKDLAELAKIEFEFNEERANGTEMHKDNLITFSIEEDQAVIKLSDYLGQI